MAAVGRGGSTRASLLRRLACALPVLCLATAVLLPAPAHAQASDPETAERQVKAAYVSKFASYVEWPPPAFTTMDAPVNIGVLGDDSMAAYISQLVAGRMVNGRPVKVHTLSADSPVAGLHILFVGRSLNPQLHQVLASARSLPLLTVTEAEDALAHGSMINFVMVDGRVRFEVSQKAAQPHNVRISARLLAAATRVIVGR
jgi:prepilin-type processing-associated H-X9-DG protein